MTRSRSTADVFVEQDQLARAYKSPTEPTREKERLADVWVVEGGIRSIAPKPQLPTKPIRVRMKPKPFKKLYQLKGRSNG